MTIGSPHPGDERLMAFNRGESCAQEQTAIGLHLDHCPPCMKRLEHLSSTDPVLGRIRAANQITEDASNTVDHLPAPAEQGSSADSGTLTSVANHSAPPSRLPSLLPAQLGDYEILAEVGRGGMGVVYKARQRRLNRLAAVKTILAFEHTSGLQLLRFQREAEMAARVRHANVVQVYEVDTHGGRPFIAMEWIEGPTLADHVGDRPLPPTEAAQLIELLAQAVQAAHSQGVVHRDLKPSNILLQQTNKVTGRQGDKETKDGASIALSPKITDFGLARPVEGEGKLTQTGAILGTPEYMSPEQARGDKVSTACDLYSLGVILYKLLTGRPPFQTDSAIETLRQITEREPVSPRLLNGRVPRDLETVCLKCLEKRPDRRYTTAAALAEDLRRFLDHRPIQARPVGWGGRLARWGRRNPLVASLLLAIQVLAMGGFLAVFAQWCVAVAREQQAKELAVRVNKTNEQLRESTYVARLRLAGHALESGSADLVRDLLDEQLPLPDQKDLRGFEWYYLRNALRQELFTLRGHTERVTGVVFSADGARLVSASMDGSVKWWDARTGRLEKTLQPTGEHVSQACYSPDGLWLATAHLGGKVRIWDARSGDLQLTFKADPSAVHRVAFCCDGVHLATAGRDMLAKIWDFRTGQLRVTCKGHTGEVTSVTFGPQGLRLASASTDGAACIWDARTGKVIQKLSGHAERVADVVFNADGTRIATASHDRTVKIWDPSSGRELLTLKGHTAWVSAVAFSPNGARIASASQDQTLKIWDVRTGGELRTLRGHTHAALSVAFSPDGTRLASASHDRTAKVWDAQLPQGGPVLRGHTSWAHGVAFSPDSTRLASASYDKTIKLWDFKSGREIRTLQGHTKSVVWVEFSPDGNSLVSTSHDQTAKVWDVNTGQLQQTFKEHTGQVFAAVFSPDGQRIASVSGDQTIKLWNARTGEVQWTFKGHAKPVYGVAFSPDGSLLASASEDQTVKLWDARSGREQKTLVGHPHVVYAVAFSPDGVHLASASRDRTLKIWDVATGQELRTLRGHGGEVRALAYSPDGTRLVSASEDQTVRVWDARIGQEILTLKGHTGWVPTVAFSPDGTCVASGSQDQTIRIWETRRSEECGESLESAQRSNVSTSAKEVRLLVQRAAHHASRADWQHATADALEVLRLKKLADSAAPPWFATDWYGTRVDSSQEPANRDLNHLTYQPIDHDVNGVLILPLLSDLMADSWIYAESPMDLVLHVGPGQNPKLWLNDSALHSGGPDLPEDRDPIRVPVRLRAGWNTLRLKPASQSEMGFVGIRFGAE